MVQRSLPAPRGGADGRQGPGRLCAAAFSTTERARPYAARVGRFGCGVSEVRAEHRPAWVRGAGKTKFEALYESTRQNGKFKPVLGSNFRARVSKHFMNINEASCKTKSSPYNWGRLYYPFLVWEIEAYKMCFASACSVSQY